MTSFLTTSEERDLFLRWLEEQKDEHRKAARALATANPDPQSFDNADYWHKRGAYEAYMAVLAYVKTGGKLI